MRVRRSLAKDALFWWDYTSETLRKMLFHAGYSIRSQQNAMAFYYTVIAPSLGPSPTTRGDPRRWHSFMTDDFSPIEFSWNWGNQANGHMEPKVRLSIEAIGDKAGSSADPWNRKTTIDLVNQLRPTVPGMDSQLFDRFVDEFSIDKGNDVSTESIEPFRHHSSFFLAFEFKNHMSMVKAYALPLAKAMQTSQSVSAVILDALNGLAQDTTTWPTIPQFSSFLETRSKELQLKPLFVAFDCVAPSRSRLKVYARSSDTSFASVEVIMSMFDEQQNTTQGLAALRVLWQLTLGLDQNFCSDQHLPLRNHYTAGILYCFQIRPGNTKISPKVYIPVKHYGRNDMDIAQGLAAYFRDRNRCHEQIVQRYLQALQEICTYRSLSAACGLQTYISCGIENGSLDITSYLSPEIYHKGRWKSSL